MDVITAIRTSSTCKTLRRILIRDHNSYIFEFWRKQGEKLKYLLSMHDCYTYPLNFDDYVKFIKIWEGGIFNNIVPTNLRHSLNRLADLLFKFVYESNESWKS